MGDYPQRFQEFAFRVPLLGPYNVEKMKMNVIIHPIVGLCYRQHMTDALPIYMCLLCVIAMQDRYAWHILCRVAISVLNQSQNLKSIIREVFNSIIVLESIFW